MTQSEKNIQITFQNGIVSSIDTHVHKLITELQEMVNNQEKLPLFWNLTRSINQYDEIFVKFYSYILANSRSSKAQLFQDLFVLFMLNEKRGGTFLEFGATDGIELSNSFLLESKYGWRGVLAEPSPQWHKKLKENRPNSNIITECIYSETGKKLDFFVSDVGVLSTLDQFRNSDISSMPGNTKARNLKGYNHEVSTISLNDVFIKHFDGSPIDYMSVDTEGSELLILQHFDFEKFAPKIVSVEHNYTDSQNKLDDLFKENKYIRFFKEHTQFDAWYILTD